MHFRRVHPGRRALERAHPARRRARYQLDRHGGRVRPRSLGGDRCPRAARYPGRRSALRLHQGRPRVGRARPRRAATPHRRSAEPAPGGRRIAPPARCRAHRLVPDALARRGWHAARRLLGHPAAAQSGGEGRRRRAFQSRCGAARSSGARRSCGHSAATVFGDPPGGRGWGASLVRRAPHRSHRLQPDAIGPAHGRLQRRARRSTRRGRLALPLSRLFGRGAATQCCPGGRAAAGRAAARYDGRCRGGRLDARLAGRDRGNRWRPTPHTGGRLDRRGEPRADRCRPGRHCRGYRAHGRGHRTGPAVKLLALVIVLGLCLSGVGVSQAPDTSGLGPRLSLETVVARTLVYSPGVAGAQGAVRDAAALRRVTLGAYLPSVYLNSSAGWTDQSLASAGATSLAQPSTVNAYGAGLAAAVDVFTGGRRGAQRSQAEAISGAADAGLVQQRYATILLARQGYFGVLRAHELVRVAQESIVQAELGLGYARDREQAGTATRADVLLAQLAAATARRQWLAARDTLGMTTAALGRLVGADGPVDADAHIPLEPAPLALSDSGVLALAPAAAPAVVNAQALANADAAAVRASETQYLPTISLGAGYNWSNDGRVTGAPRSGWIVALSTSFPLFNGFVREAAVTQAKVAAEVASAASADTKRFARAEAQRLVGSLRVAEQDIALSRESVRLATEELRVIRARYRAGIATILDVLTSQTALTQAELDLVSALFTYQVARASLEALLGRDL